MAAIICQFLRTDFSETKHVGYLALFTLPSQLSVMKRNPEKGDCLKPRVTEPGKATEPGVTGDNVPEKVNKTLFPYDPLYHH
jgi:hypothetical protein